MVPKSLSLNPMGCWAEVTSPCLGCPVLQEGNVLKMNDISIFQDFLK
jgi:hypothetical protein